MGLTRADAGGSPADRLPGGLYGANGISSCSSNTANTWPAQGLTTHISRHIRQEPKPRPNVGQRNMMARKKHNQRSRLTVAETLLASFVASLSTSWSMGIAILSCEPKYHVQRVLEIRCTTSHVIMPQHSEPMGGHPKWKEQYPFRCLSHLPVIFGDIWYWSLSTRVRMPLSASNSLDG